MVLGRLIDVSRVMTQRMSGDCVILPVDSSVMREMLGSPALMVEVIQELRRQHHRLSGHAWLIQAALGCLRIFSCSEDPFSSPCCTD